MADTFDQYSDEELQWLAKIESQGAQPPKHIEDQLRQHQLLRGDLSEASLNILGSTMLEIARRLGRV